MLAVHPGPIEFERMPFVNVARLFSALPVPVPASSGIPIRSASSRCRIWATSRCRRISAPPPRRAQGAVPPGGRLHRNAAAARRRAGVADYLPYGIAFDVEKLTWELQFFAKHFLEGYRGVDADAAARAALAGEFTAIAEELAGEPRVLCHRDYHSRNLMLHEGSLYIIDFQDARMGPDTYDLVSLLRDSYVDFTEPEVEELIAFFLALRRGPGADGGARMRAGVPPALRPDGRCSAT